MARLEYVPMYHVSRLTSYKLSFLVGPRLEQLGTGKGLFGVNFFPQSSFLCGGGAKSRALPEKKWWLGKPEVKLHIIHTCSHSCP